MGLQTNARNSSIKMLDLPNALRQPLFTLNLPFILFAQLQNIIKFQLFAGGTWGQSVKGSTATVFRWQRRRRRALRDWGCANWWRRRFRLADMR